MTRQYKMPYENCIMQYTVHKGTTNALRGSTQGAPVLHKTHHTLLIRHCKVHTHMYTCGAWLGGGSMRALSRRTCRGEDSSDDPRPTEYCRRWRPQGRHGSLWGTLRSGDSQALKLPLPLPLAAVGAGVEDEAKDDRGQRRGRRRGRRGRQRGRRRSCRGLDWTAGARGGPECGDGGRYLLLRSTTTTQPLRFFCCASLLERGNPLLLVTRSVAVVDHGPTSSWWCSAFLQQQPGTYVTECVNSTM